MSNANQGSLFTPIRQGPFDGRPFRGAHAASGDRDRRPRVDALVPRLLDALESRGGWVSARVLARELNADDRSIREAAHQSGGLVLGAQKGYIHVTKATVEEVQDVTRWLLSQSARMRERVLQIEKIYHAKGGGVNRDVEAGGDAPPSSPAIGGNGER